MKATLEIENKEVLNEDAALLERIQALLLTSKPLIKTWLIAQIEVALSEIPFREASIEPTLAPAKDVIPNRMLTVPEASKQ